MSLWSPRPRPAVTAAAPIPTSVGRSSTANGSLGAKVAGTDPIPGHAAQQWQWDVWSYYDSSGVLKFAGMFRGNMYRRVRLAIGVRPPNDPDGIPIPADDILDPEKPETTAPPGVPLDLIRQAQVDLARIRGTMGVQGILYDLGVNLTVAGDCRLAVIPDSTQPNAERWQVYSVIELRQSGTWPSGQPRWTELGPPSRVLPEGTIVWRVYSPHPARHSLADSSAMGVLPDLEELALLGRQFRGLAKSRVPSAGVFVFPKELGLGKPADPNDPDGPSKIAVDLSKHMSSALRRDDAASNLVPFFIEGPADLLKPDSLRHIPFTRPADEIMNKRETATLERIAMGLDTPPEIILGIGDVNHWNGAQVSADSWKAHGEPGMIVICSQLTESPLRSMLLGASTLDATGLPSLDGSRRWTPEQIAQIVVIGDPANVIDHPDRGKDAKDLHASFVLSDAALREANNFGEADKPDDTEIDERVERERLIHSRGSDVQAIPPGYVTGTPAPGGSTLPSAQPTSAPPSGNGPPAARPTTPAPGGGRGNLRAVPARTAALVAAGGRDPGSRMGAIDRTLFASMHATAQAAMRRALERAGNRISNKAQRNRAVMEIVRTAPNRTRVAARLGRELVASIGVADDDLDLDFDYTDLLDQMDASTDRARDAGLAALLAFGGRTLTDAEAIEYRNRVETHRQAARTWFGEAMVGLTYGELYAPDSSGVVGPGEGVEAATVPPGLVRAALALYGGQDLGPNGKPDGEPFRGVAGGADNLTVGASLGVVTDVWQWAHGAPLHPFEPHEDLDGQVFGYDEAADAGRLANVDDSWTGLGEYWPGDHDGCTCWAIPLLAPDVSGGGGE